MSNSAYFLRRIPIKNPTLMHQGLVDKIQQLLAEVPDTDEKELLFCLKQIVEETELEIGEYKESSTITDLIEGALVELKEESEGKNIIKTGFADFDNKYGGLGLGEFVILGGRPAMGKTQLLVNLSLFVSQSIPAAYYSFDLSEYLLTYRFISASTRISINKIFQRKLTATEKEKINKTQAIFTQHKLYLNANCGRSIAAIRADCIRQIRGRDVKLIVIDYIQMLQSNRYRKNRELEISYVSRELKRLAKELNVCIVATSQLSRAVETRSILDKRPKLSDLRDSGAIEQDADMVLFLYRPEYYQIDENEMGEPTNGVAELIVAKNRNGSTGTVKLSRDKDFTNFSHYNESRPEFTFDHSRLDELKDKNPQLGNLINQFGINEDDDIIPF